MSFAAIDAELRRWASANNVKIATECKDCEVRSFEVATRFGSVQVWVEPRPDGRLDAVASNNRAGAARRLDRVEIDGTAAGPALDRLLSLVTQWKW